MMISGRVNIELDALVTITISGRNGSSLTIDAAIDTGFNDRLALPRSMIEQLALQTIGYTTAVLGNGEEVQFTTFEAAVLWSDERMVIPVLETGGAALVGTELLRGLRLTIDYVESGAVTLEQRPESRQP
jgi:clan AA aspartic protease